MKTNTDIGEVEFLIKMGIKGGGLLALLLTLIAALIYFLIVYFTNADFSTAFTIFFFTLIPSVLVIAIGVVVIMSILLSLENKATHGLAGFIGFGVGTVLTLAVNYLLYLGFYRYTYYYNSFFEYIYFSFILFVNPFFLSSILDVLLLTYVGWKMNSTSISGNTISTKE